MNIAAVESRRVVNCNHTLSTVVALHVREAQVTNEVSNMEHPVLLDQLPARSPTVHKWKKQSKWR